LAVLFIHNEGYSTMCGHAVIALGRWAVDSGIVPRREGETRVAIQCPCGLVAARVAGDGAVRFTSVSAFAFALDAEVQVPGAAAVKLAFVSGGPFFALRPRARFGPDVRRSPTRDLVDAAQRVTEAAKAQIPLAHPDDPDLAFLYGTVLTDGADASDAAPTA